MDHSSLSLVPLHKNEGDYDQAEANEGPTHRWTVPCFGDASPLHSQIEADDGSNNQEHAANVHLDQQSPPTGICFRRFFDEEHQDERGGQPANRQIDTKATMLSAEQIGVR